MALMHTPGSLQSQHLASVSSEEDEAVLLKFEWSKIGTEKCKDTKSF